ncbi:hypothetical protein BGZ82_006295 [Podila clonocystis]|nr:hypothetical protein BGZ82_006295 [Podila clonocystis]
MPFDSKVPGLTILAKVTPAQAEILTPEVLQFVATLHRTYEPTRQLLLQRRQQRQVELDNGRLPDFLPETRNIREDATWRAAKPAPGLQDRRVEITGPVDRKMVINALNSGAATFMADFEDSNAPTWENNINGQTNLKDAIHQRISYTAPNGKQYNIRKDGKARLWNDVFNTAQDYIGIPRGTIRATALIETILGAFEMDEIIYELREHSAGLNCGRWDYIFSFIKKLRQNPDFVLPDRSDISMTTPFMDAYVRLLIKTCHKRGVHAMGGMAAQIPIKNNEAANKAAMDKVHNDKLREVKAGHDGTWPNQLHIRRDDVHVTASDLLNTDVKGAITEAGIRANVSVSLIYMEAWLRGLGCVPIHNLMEDAATAEISRSQLWQWAKHGARTIDGTVVTPKYLLKVLDEETQLLAQSMGEQRFQASKMIQAKAYLATQITGEDYSDFLTSLLYNDIVEVEKLQARI